MHSYRPVNVLSDLQSRYVNVARDDNMYTCMFLCGQCVLKLIFIMSSERDNVIGTVYICGFCLIKLMR